MEILNCNIEFTKEELEILRTILFERSTHFSQKATELQVLNLKCNTVNNSDFFKFNANHYLAQKRVVDKFYDFLKNF